MRSTFSGLQLGLKALQAQQVGLNLAGHNIANANTPGYSRQRVHLVAGAPYTVPAFNRPRAPGQLGTGVEVAEIERMRNAFVEMQLRAEYQTTGKWQALQDGYEQIELIFNEPSDSGIAHSLIEFWKSLQQLSLTPGGDGSLAARAVVRQNGALLSDAIRHTYSQLQRYQMEINGAIEVKVGKINNIARQIADLNEQIVAVTATGDNANDLLDTRDLLINELAKIVNIQVVEDSSQAVSISITGSALVQGATVTELDITRDTEGLVHIQWHGLDIQVQFKGGEIKGLLELRDEILPDYMKKLDDLATAIIEEINAIHETGYDLNGVSGRLFFAGSGAKDINLHDDITGPDGLAHIAAGKTATPGDGDNALEMARVQSKVVDKLSGTIPDFFSSLISQLGVDSQEAQRMVTNQTVLVEHLEKRQEAISGVSLDEEMGNLIRYQHAYNAAARLITAIDECLTTIIERMGIVGR